MSNNKPFEPLLYPDGSSVQENDYIPLDKIICDTVYACPGCPKYNILGAVMDQNSLNLVPLQTSYVINARLNHLVDTGKIVSMSIQNKTTAFREILYFPPECSFQISGFAPSPATKAIHLLPAVKEVATSISCLLRNTSNDVRMFVVQQYCPTCGEESQGHICKRA